MNAINSELCNSIKEGKWCQIEYENKTGEHTFYWIFIKNINPETKILSVIMYNHELGDKISDGYIHYESIRSAKMVEFSTNDKADVLIEKLENNPESFVWLEYEKFNNNILSYLEECYYLDNDPYQTEYHMINGIDYSVLKEKKHIKLSREQMADIYNLIKDKDINGKDGTINELALSLLSIDSGGKKYIYVYQHLLFNPKKEELSLEGEIKFNATFMIEGKKHSLSMYTEMNVGEFQKAYIENPLETTAILQDGIHNNTEQIDTRPDLFVLQRQTTIPLHKIYASIEKKHQEKSLGVPCKAFFGDITVHDNGNKRPDFVLFDDKVNADQMFVIYSAMKNPVTYVQGPPGTGKTQTLFNVIISAYYNSKTVLVTTNNNIPVDGIISKLKLLYRNKEVPFPFLRLGNRNNVLEATKKIYSLYQHDFIGDPIDSKIDSIKENARRKNNKLGQALTSYREKKIKLDQLECYKKLQSKLDKPNHRLNEAIFNLQKEIDSMNVLSDEELVNLARPVKNDDSFMQYLYYSSIGKIKKLRFPRYKELIEIVSIKDDEERCTKFNSWTAKDENMKLLLEAFPIIFTTNMSVHRLGTETMFDLAIMDEAGQCPIAVSLIPVFKAKSLLMVGDELQLKPITLILPQTNYDLLQKYKIHSNYDYCENSILSCMQASDKVSNKLLLRYHYRCGKRIIDFSNKYFYDSLLRISNSAGEGHLQFFDCKTNPRNRNESLEEALGVVGFIKKKENKKNIVVITPFVNQQNLIRRCLDNEGLKDIEVCTVHKMQGGEADTVILSLAVNPKTSVRTMEWLNSHKEIANVSISRAKKDFILFCDKESIDKKCKKNDIWNQLSDYVKSNGMINVIPPIKKEIIGWSNGSVTEDEFFETLKQITSIKTKLKVVRNVKMDSIFPDTQYQGEFDSVIYEKPLIGRLRAIVAFEFDGGEHYQDAERIRLDELKEKTCREHDLRLVRLPNNLAKDYEFILSLIKTFSHEEKEEGEQLRLI